MNKDYFISLYDYTYWANRKVWDCVMQLSEEQFKQDLDYSIGAIWMQMAHTMLVEHWWFTFLNEGFIPEIDENAYPTRDAIRAKWDEVETYVRAYLDKLTPEELERSVKPSFWDEEEAPVQVWQALLQVANHSTDHRAQTLAGLHRLGAPTVGQDYLSYWDDKTLK